MLFAGYKCYFLYTEVIFSIQMLFYLYRCYLLDTDVIFSIHMYRAIVIPYNPARGIVGRVRVRVRGLEESEVSGSNHRARF